MSAITTVEELLKQPRIIPQSCCEYRSTQLITFHPCNPVETHEHADWVYDCSAWSTVQTKGHCGVGGTCVGGRSTTDWKAVVQFYQDHKDAQHCSITAQRLSWKQGLRSMAGTTQY